MGVRRLQKSYCGLFAAGRYAGAGGGKERKGFEKAEYPISNKEYPITKALDSVILNPFNPVYPVKILLRGICRVTGWG